MSSDASFVTYVEDQLHALGDVRSRAMFGGHGVYAGNVFFAVIASGRLYFKTDARTRARYVDAGMTHFEPLKNYYEVPVDVIEDDGELVVWAREAVLLGETHLGT